MTSVLLIYPFLKPAHDNSEFRFPPLGLAYIASSLRAAGHEVSILDCSFLRRDRAVSIARASAATVVGIYSMITMREESLFFARIMKKEGRLLVAGGPYPTGAPAAFLDDFDIVVRGEGEATMLDIVEAFEGKRRLASIPGVVCKTDRTVGDCAVGDCAVGDRDAAVGDCEIGDSAVGDCEVGDRVAAVGDRGSAVGDCDAADPASCLTAGPARALAADLDAIPLPARDLLPNRLYIEHGRRRYGYSITSVMSSRGCPFDCEFCSNAVFGRGFRERSPANVADEVEDALSYGYERIHFGDDVFTLKKERIIAVCDEIRRRKLEFSWECLGRVDSIDAEAARAMREAGCDRIFFGIESGDERMLGLMRKRITTARARQAVEAARGAGIRTGAFFILFYPGDTDDSVLQTIRFATSLPLDYLSFSLPYPIPGTALHERVGNRAVRDWKQPQGLVFKHLRIFDSDFSEFKMKFGLVKAKLEFELRRRGPASGSAAFRIFEAATDFVLRRLS